MAHDLMLRAVQSIYAAASGDGDWSGALGSLCDLLGAHSAAVELRNFDNQHTRVSASFNIDAKKTQEYEDYYTSKNILLIRGKGVIAEGRVFNNQMLCPINEYLRSEYYNDCLRTLDVCHIMGGSVLDGSGTAALLSLMRPQSAPAFSHEEMRTLSVLMPHLKQAVALRTRLREVELVKEGLAAALDWITLGVILISPALEILAANRSAREILAASDGLACTRGQLQVTDRTARDQLGMLLRAGRGDARLPAGGPISVPRPSMRRNYALFVCLAPPKLAAFVGGNRRRFSIFIVAPETVPQPPCELLVRWFGLTPAEARLTMILLQGLTLKEAAEQLAVARNTVHSQLASVFSKTGTRRQSELVKLLSGVAQLRYGAGGGSAA